MNYSTSTRQRVADMNLGLRVETGTLLGTTYLIQNQVELFTITGRIIVRALFAEVIAAISATVTYLAFSYTSTTPSIAVQPISGVCASLSGAAQGTRIQLVGTAYNTASIITYAPGYSYAATPNIMLGMHAGVGTIGMLSSNANATSGSIKVILFYEPASSEGSAVAIL